MKNVSVLFACLFAGTVVANAADVFADDFSYDDDTPLSGQTPDVGAKWTGGNGWKTSGGAASLVGGSDSVYGNFTSALSEGQKLTVTFNTQAIAGFLGSSWAVVSLYDATNNERAYIGDPGGSNTTWGMGGIGNVWTSDSSQANTATFTYEYDTGAWTFTTNGGTYTGPGTPHLAINRLRIASGGTSDSPGGNMKLDDITVSIEQITPVPLKITAFTRVDANTYRLAWSGGDGTNDVEASTDLINWETIIFDAATPVDIPVDTEIEPKRFYRVVEPVPSPT